MKRQLLQIAKSSREWAETNRGKFPTNLQGMCMRASHQLYAALRAAGFCPSFYYSSRHVAVTVHDWIIDITATQFKEYAYAKVVLTTQNRYKINKLFRFQRINISEMKELGKSWPNIQRFWTKMK